MFKRFSHKHKFMWSSSLIGASAFCFSNLKIPVGSGRDKAASGAFVWTGLSVLCFLHPDAPTAEILAQESDVVPFQVDFLYCIV